MNGSMATIRVQTLSIYDNLEKSKIKDTSVFTRSHVRLGTIGVSGNFHRDWKMYDIIATIRVETPSKHDILKSTSNVQHTFKTTRSSVRSGTIKTSGNFHGDSKKYGNMATTRVLSRSTYDILKSYSKIPSCSPALRFD